MALHPLAGKVVPASHLSNIPQLISDYYLLQPDIANSTQQVSFGTSGHRGCAHERSFNESHLLSIAQAICDYRQAQNVQGPLFLGMDTHALSEPAFCSVIEVLVANQVKVVVQQDRGYTPTPVITHAIVSHNAQHSLLDLADGIVITPSHNPPKDGGLKYNGCNGGPADTQVTGWVQDRANQLLADKLVEVKRTPFSQAINSSLVSQIDFASDYVDDLANVLDMDAIANAKLKIAVDPLGGSGIHYWRMIAKKYQLDIELLNDQIDPRFAFMTLDKDGEHRIDCSSPYCISQLIEQHSHFDIGISNDPDFDRHGIVSSHGFVNPSHYMVTSIDYLLRHRPDWPQGAMVGKSVMASAMIDRVVAEHGKQMFEAPVGFKWFVQSLNDATMCFAGEDSAGASFLRKDGTVWGVDKDGFIMGLLAAEMLAVTGKTPQQLYAQLTERYGTPIYRRIDVPATPEQKAQLKCLDKSSITGQHLAGEEVIAIHTHAPGNEQTIGGVKVVCKSGWFAARPSGTEPLYKVYVESFIDQDHLSELEQQARAMVDRVLS